MNPPPVHPDHEPRNEHEQEVIAALRTVLDPEIPVNIIDLGLVYDVKVDGTDCNITMTLTSQSCPEAKTIPDVM